MLDLKTPNAVIMLNSRVVLCGCGEDKGKEIAVVIAYRKKPVAEGSAWQMEVCAGGLDARLVVQVHQPAGRRPYTPSQMQSKGSLEEEPQKIATPGQLS